jgi:hypothetical protein
MVRIVTLLVVLALVGPATAPAAEKLKVTIPAAAVTFASLYHAKAANYFTEEGLDVEIVTVAGGGALQALIAKDAQICVAPSTYQLQAWEKGQKLIATGSISLSQRAASVFVTIARTSTRLAPPQPGAGTTRAGAAPAGGLGITASVVSYAPGTPPSTGGSGAGADEPDPARSPELRA